MKLLIFTACDRVIQDPTFGPSLISVFHGLSFKGPDDVAVPGDAVIPKDWAIYAKWGLEPHELGKNYSSQIEIYWPDGSEFARHRIDAIQPTNDGMSFVHRTLGFPIGQQGSLKVALTLDSDGVSVFGPVDLEIKVNDPHHLAIAPAMADVK